MIVGIERNFNINIKLLFDFLKQSLLFDVIKCNLLQLQVLQLEKTTQDI